MWEAVFLFAWAIMIALVVSVQFARYAAEDAKAEADGAPQPETKSPAAARAGRG
jgi:hypothetical protein